MAIRADCTRAKKTHQKYKPLIYMYFFKKMALAQSLQLPLHVALQALMELIDMNLIQEKVFVAILQLRSDHPATA